MFAPGHLPSLPPPLKSGLAFPVVQPATFIRGGGQSAMFHVDAPPRAPVTRQPVAVLSQNAKSIQFQFQFILLIEPEHQGTQNIISFCYRMAFFS